MSKIEIPDYLLNAVAPNTRQPNPERMSVTSLFDSPLIRTLQMEHWNEITEEVDDMLWALYGIALDTIVKQNCREGLTQLKMELPLLDYVLVGQPDIYYLTNELLADLKTTSVWNLKEPRREWIMQLNTYRYMMSKLYPTLKVNKLQVHGLARDWRKNEKLKYNNYPDSAFVILDIPIIEDMEQVIDAAMKEHKHCSKRECTFEEKWQKEDTFAVMKKGQKSAKRVLDSIEEALDWCKENKYAVDNNIISIVKRPGECVRCQSYCKVSKFCPYFNPQI